MMKVASLLAALIGLAPINAFAFQSSSIINRSRGKISSTTKWSLTKKQGIENTPVVICPGFGNDSIDYSEPLKQDYSKSLIYALEKRNFNPDLIYTVPVQRSDWIRVATGLFDIPDFYVNKAKPTGLGYGWYVKRVKDTVDRAFLEGGGENKVLLIGHSAGGWLARAAMGDGTWRSEGDGGGDIRTADRVKCLATIGAIHKVPGGDPSTCVTRGALSYTDKMYPGDFLKAEGVKYVSVGGGAIIGNQDNISNDSDSSIERTEVDDIYSVRGEGSSGKVAYTSYEAVCGEGGVIGDGVVPLEWTQLDGAKQIRLDGVLHSINEAGTTLPTDRWYGSDGVVDRWLPAVCEEAEIVRLNDASNKSNGAFKFFFDMDAVQKWTSVFTSGE